MLSCVLLYACLGLVNPVKSWSELAEAGELLFESVSLAAISISFSCWLHLLHHHQRPGVCECDDAPSKCWWCDPGRIPQLYYIFSLFARCTHTRLECIPLYTSSNPPPAQPSLHTLHVAALVFLDPQVAHSVHPQSWPLQPPQPCFMRPSPRLAPGPPSRPTFKRRNTTTSTARASSILGTRTLSADPWNCSAPWHGDRSAGR